MENQRSSKQSLATLKVTNEIFLGELVNMHVGVCSGTNLKYLRHQRTEHHPKEYTTYVFWVVGWAGDQKRVLIFFPPNNFCILLS